MYKQCGNVVTLCVFICWFLSQDFDSWNQVIECHTSALVFFKKVSVLHRCKVLSLEQNQLHVYYFNLLNCLVKEGETNSWFWNTWELQHWDLQHSRNQEHPVLSRVSCRSSDRHGAVSSSGTYSLELIATLQVIRSLTAFLASSIVWERHFAPRLQKLSDDFLTCFSPSYWEVFVMPQQHFRAEWNSEASCACE